jgi:hypothetical protein
MDGKLTMWVIYDHPKDYPHDWVARQWSIGWEGRYAASGNALRSNKLDTLRGQMVKLGLTCLARSPEDDPVIVEAWV